MLLKVFSVIYLLFVILSWYSFCCTKRRKISSYQRNILFDDDATSDGSCTDFDIPSVTYCTQNVLLVLKRGIDLSSHYFIQLTQQLTLHQQFVLVLVCFTKIKIVLAQILHIWF